MAPKTICRVGAEGLRIESRTNDGKLSAAVDQYAGHKVGFSAIVQSCMDACEHVSWPTS